SAGAARAVRAASVRRPGRARRPPGRRAGRGSETRGAPASLVASDPPPLVTSMPGVEAALGQLWDTGARRSGCALHRQVLLARCHGGRASVRRRPGARSTGGTAEDGLPRRGLPPRRRPRALPLRVVVARVRQARERAGGDAVRARDRDGLGRLPARRGSGVRRSSPATLDRCTTTWWSSRE